MGLRDCPVVIAKSLARPSASMKVRLLSASVLVAGAVPQTASVGLTNLSSRVGKVLVAMRRYREW